MSQGTSNHVPGFVSHISGAEHPASSLVFFTSAILSLRLILKGTLHTRTNPHLPFYLMFCLNVCPDSYGVTALTARWIRTRRVRLVIRDKSCQHYMTKSLRGKCSHVCLGVCVGRVAQEMRIYVGYEYENIHMLQTGQTFHLSLCICLYCFTIYDVIYTVSSYLHTSHTKMHYLCTTPCRTKCTLLGRTYNGRKNLMLNVIIS